MFDKPIIGTIIPFAGEVAPEGWMFCQGQELKINDYITLFTLIENTFGGNRETTFNLPNLCGRVAVHAGRPAGMPQYTRGQMGGNERVTISVDNLPAHTHTVTITGRAKCSSASGTEDMPTGHYPAPVTASPDSYTIDGLHENMGKTDMATTQTTEAFSGRQNLVPVLSPYLVMNFIICVDGYYPDRED
jgi:microcystin-dependent protein